VTPEPKGAAVTGNELADLIEHVRTHSPYYRDLYAGLPADAALTDLPVANQTGFWAAMTEGRLLTGPHTDGMVFKTGGTTSAPKVSYYTNAEWRRMSRTFGHGLAGAGLRAGDRVANLFYAGELYSSFVFTLNTLQEADIPVVQLPIAGSASPEFVVRQIVDFDVTVLAAPPTSLCRLAQHVLDNDGPLPGVRLALFSGEACYGDQLALLATAFPNVTVRSIGYASVDAGILAGPVTDDRDVRVHEVFTGDKVVEILDLESGEPIECNGRPGRVVATDLTRRLMPVLRYPVGDIAEWTDFGQRRLRLLGRSEEGARIGPVTLYLDDLRAIVNSVDERGEVSAMQVVLRHSDRRDELVLRMAGRVNSPELLAKLVAAKLDEARPMFAEHVRAGLVHPLAVEWVAPDELINPRTGKLVRLLDQRSA
jgi:phenylacetate-CoA ligase